VGIGKRIVDLARANLNALLDKANGETRIDELTDEELEAELQRRRERRGRLDEERRAAARAAENARQRTASRPGAGPPPPRPASTSASASASASSASRKQEQQRQRKAPPPSGPPIADKRLRELYAQLEVPYGAPFEDVKRSFRRLMRKYHPDLHAGHPQKQKTATQLTMSLTQAYNELEQHLTGGRHT
jgi:multidrug efflux pump subunit AcrA (membrane-fusion protein)